MRELLVLIRREWLEHRVMFTFPPAILLALVIVAILAATVMGRHIAVQVDVREDSGPPIPMQQRSSPPSQHYLVAYAPDSRNTVVFAGFQAAGTRGRALVDGAREIKIHGRWIPVRAEVADLSMLSAHADCEELKRWLSGFRHQPSRVHIVHGEPDSSEALRIRIDRELGWRASVPRPDQAIKL